MSSEVLKLWRFYWDCGRMGMVEGLFITDDKHISKLIGKEIYFGEILGKHSEIEGIISKEDIKEISDDQDFIMKLQKVFGGNTISGYNPFDSIEEEEGEE